MSLLLERGLVPNPANKATEPKTPKAGRPPRPAVKAKLKAGATKD